MKLKTIVPLTILFASLVALPEIGLAQAKKPTPAGSTADKPNILVIFGDDIGQTNVSAYSMGMMGYRTPNIDRIAKEGMIFTDHLGDLNKYLPTVHGFDEYFGNLYHLNAEEE